MDRIPPQNTEAEQSLLGSLLIDRDAIIKIADKVTSEDFYRDTHRQIYQAMLDLYGKHEPIDLLSLANRLLELGQLEGIGGRAYIAELANTVPTASHVHHYADIVAKKATLRRLLRAAGDITELGYTEDQELVRVLDQAESKLFSVSQRLLKQSFIPVQTVLEGAFDRIDELHRDHGKLRGLPTGFTELDNLLAGLQRSDLVVLAARPSVGKTSLALDMVRGAAVKNKIPVGIFSLEMSKEQLVDRLICAEAGVNMWNMRTGRLTSGGGRGNEQDDFARIAHAMGILAEAPIYIDDSATANIMEIRTKARRLQMEHGLGLLVIDYLQLLESFADAESRVQVVSEITRSLKSIARELNIPVLALSQLNRSPELRKPAIPKLADLRESGSLEQDSDVVMFIYRKAADKNYQADDLRPDERNIAEIHIAKHRNGPTGLIKLYFDEQRVSFKNLER